MRKALVILHAAPLAADQRALTALRLGGALMADSKQVCLFLVEEGLRLIDPQLAADHPCRALFRELIELDLDVQVCGATLRKMGWDERDLPAGVQKSAMKALSALMTDADEIVSF